MAARESRWARAAARWLARWGLRPKAISLLSVTFAAGAGGAFVAARFVDSPQGRALLFIAAIIGIQLRLLCNLFDGMIAIEGGYRTKSGELYNELPDRFSDGILLTAAGYSDPTLPWLSALGWCAAVLAVITAYVRALGASIGAAQFFIGPMAKPHRMAVLTAGAIVSVWSAFYSARGAPIAAALGLILLGCVVTIARRSLRIIGQLESK
ncbi:MAG: CDP-alcohol phosphatidyltransferase family protein [Planctomycetaceae bacterium]